MTLQRAQAQVDVVAERSRTIEPGYRGTGLQFRLEPMQRYLVAQVQPAILALSQEEAVTLPIEIEVEEREGGEASLRGGYGSFDGPRLVVVTTVHSVGNEQIHPIDQTGNRLRRFRYSRRAHPAWFQRSHRLVRAGTRKYYTLQIPSR